MHPKGIIYQNGRSGTHGEIILFLPVIARLVFHFIRGLGAGLIAFSFLTFAFSFGPVIQQEISYNLEKTGLKTQRESVNESFSLSIAEADRILAVQKEAQSYEVNSYFSVVIPTIDAKANVIANVDVSNKSDYLEALKKGIAHAKGTYFPGQGGRIFLFSHSTDSPLNFARYNAIFYLLKKLEKGDTIIVFFADKKYEYEIVDKIIADAGDTSWLTPKKEGEELILMTCDPPGTTWNRLLVVAKPKA